MSLLHVIDQKVAERKPLPQGIVTAAEHIWFEDSMLSDLQVPNIRPKRNIDVHGCLRVVKQIYMSQLDPVANAISPTLLAEIAYHCLLVPGREDPIFDLFPEQEKLWKDMPYDSLLEKTIDTLNNESEDDEASAKLNELINMNENSEGFPPLENISDTELKRYIGCWAFSLIRSCVKDSGWLVLYYSPTSSKAKANISRFDSTYHSINNTPGLRFPALHASFYENIHSTFKNSNEWVTKIALEACYLMRKYNGNGAKSVQSVLRGLFMISVMEYGLPLWTWCKRVSQLSHQPVTAIYGQTVTATTKMSCLTGLKFIYRYMARPEEYSALGEAASEVGTQISSTYWWVARLIQTDWLGFLGQQGNSDLIYLFIVMHDMLIGDDGKVIRSTYQSPEPLMKKKEIRRIARAITDSYRSENRVEEYSTYLQTEIKKLPAQLDPEDESSNNNNNNPFE